MRADEERPARADPMPVRRRERGFGVLLMLGLFGGLAVGLFLGQPSAGTIIGLGLGGLAALALRLAGR